MLKNADIKTLLINKKIWELSVNDDISNIGLRLTKEYVLGNITNLEHNLHEIFRTNHNKYLEMQKTLSNEFNYIFTYTNTKSIFPFLKVKYKNINSNNWGLFCTNIISYLTIEDLIDIDKSILHSAKDLDLDSLGRKELIDLIHSNAGTPNVINNIMVKCSTNLDIAKENYSNFLVVLTIFSDIRMLTKITEKESYTNFYQKLTNMETVINNYKIKSNKFNLFADPKVYAVLESAYKLDEYIIDLVNAFEIESSTNYPNTYKLLEIFKIIDTKISNVGYDIRSNSQSADYINFKRYALFFTELSDATNSQAVTEILTSATVPPVSFYEKREKNKFHISISSYLGLDGIMV